MPQRHRHVLSRGQLPQFVSELRPLCLLALDGKRLVGSRQLKLPHHDEAAARRERYRVAATGLLKPELRARGEGWSGSKTGAIPQSRNTRSIASGMAYSVLPRNAEEALRFIEFMERRARGWEATGSFQEAAPPLPE